MSGLHDELAAVVHAAMCNAPFPGLCNRWQEGSPHKDFYEMRAQNLITDLEPVIGFANVLPVVKLVLGELDL